MLQFFIISFFVAYTCTGSVLAANVHSEVSQLDGRIVGGKEVNIGKHPHQVSIRHRGCDSCPYSHTCGGSIYNESCIITAAHCVYNRVAKNFIIVAGTNYRNAANGYVVRVDKIVMHEEYISALTDNDVAVMFLSTPLPINNITTASIELTTEQPKHGDKSKITGWGSTQEGGFSATHLQEVEVPIVSNEECNAAYGAGRITDSMLCAGAVGGGKDACQGDSGGPLLVNWKLAGIVSWGRGCARPDFPGVYANVYHLKSWIEKTIQQN